VHTASAEGDYTRHHRHSGDEEVVGPTVDVSLERPRASKSVQERPREQLLETGPTSRVGPYSQAEGEWWYIPSLRHNSMIALCAGPSLVQEVNGNSSLHLWLWSCGYTGRGGQPTTMTAVSVVILEQWETGTTMAGSPQPPHHVAVKLTVREQSSGHLYHFEWVFGLNIRAWRFKVVVLVDLR
jgi:hypothetical protein